MVGIITPEGGFRLDGFKVEDGEYVEDNGVDARINNKGQHFVEVSVRQPDGSWLATLVHRDQFRNAAEAVLIGGEPVDASGVND